MTTHPLNFHHLRYFWAVAKDGNLTRTAKGLYVSQSALSAQIRQLEVALDVDLFDRVGRRLVLTEAGRLTLDYAEEIFGTGDELLATVKAGRRAEQVLRIGAVATLSRNFQESFVTPLLDQPNARLLLQSGRLDDLLDRLAQHELDLVLSNRPARREAGSAWRCRRIARQGVSIVGRPRKKPFRFDNDLAGALMILPGPDSEIRTEFDALCEQRGVKVRVLAEVDDMATLRLLARDTGGLALLPTVVVRDELRNGQLREHCVVPDLFENFYAITVDRHYQHPHLRSLLARSEGEILGMGKN
ncbi:MAG: LysR family transcriptional regulator [Planctomycetota bacterium]|nr:LysR family transcriptional regulator [Planctomycetota bacterium]